MDKILSVLLRWLIFSPWELLSWVRLTTNNTMPIAKTEIWRSNVSKNTSHWWNWVVFRGWECSHSIRSEILLRYWCPEFYNLLKKIFFRSIKKKVGKKITKILTFSILYFLFFSMFFYRSKIFFWKGLEKIRTSISKQNFTADRMGALPVPENHSKA